MISRRSFFIGMSATPLLLRVADAASPMVKVTRDPDCGCCTAWADHLRTEGFTVTVVDDPQINRLKARLGVPGELASCHTAEVDGYVIEGHVPAASIRKLLAQRSDIRGLAVPRMPVGSPGMEVEGTPPETYEVIAFGPRGHSIFAKYEGVKELTAK